ncbi:uncharacterized protein PAC_17442 [Phialocephala subalpina]|uniref:Uncharacterized protein n=1 Tax=Phialocephala subalpina TaxID=576137 RepID=A0A1L7XR69_9HELO|nr:uncharacterized protein PAC_17442 [Phialocephala subalpina]
MAALVKTWVPAPNWEIPATSPTVVLGSIIEDPKNPESRINKKGPVAIPDTEIRHDKKIDWKTTANELRSGKIGFWAQCLQVVGLGGDLNLSTLKSSLENHNFDFLETKYFLPEEIDGYMDDSVFDDYVQAYFEVAKKAVYMITGLKIARGSVVEATKKKEHGGDGKLGIDLQSVAVPVTLGPKWEFKNQEERTVGWGGSTDYIFAYRLKRIKSKKYGAYKVDNFNKGAVFGRDDDNEEESGFDIDDYDGEGFGIPDTVKEIID